MKSYLFNTIIFMLITLSVILLLSTTISSTSSKGFEDIDIEPAHGLDGANRYIDTKIEQHTLNVDYLNFKSYTMNEIEKNNQTILKITEEINETEIAIEEARLRRIHNLKLQNTQLNVELSTYQIKSNGWQSFKSNFKTNFKRMGLPFSELFPNKAKH